MLAQIVAGSTSGASEIGKAMTRCRWVSMRCDEVNALRQPNRLRLSRPGQQPRWSYEAKVAPTPRRAESAGALGRPAAVGYAAPSFGVRTSCAS